ncbi:carnitine O-palmitoyltransferase 2, mitochondrial-like [Dendronephthya gigantea]|uniref:carnitine O-palmitoyltransferase 2, mitochondrial-like n=1 Tax=Dendronephthya gigantea TaxID=151771 RepID=UPI00106D95AC|nr:carnitine O-palmitoyltransferase 2, mitochondrial-like [Dendronephthya gigantea]
MAALFALTRGRCFTPFLAKKTYGCSPILRCLSSHSDDKYIQRSIVPTYHFQPSLPRLPIPKLEDSCRRYLDAQKVILSPEEYENTKRLVENFKQNEGPELQKELIFKDKQNKHTSYISEPWTDMYLKDRRSVMLNHNPFMTFKQDSNTDNNHQLVRATNFIISSMKFKNSLDEEILDPEIFHLNPKKSDTDWFKRVIRFVPSSLSWYGAYLVKAFPLDMSQYTRMFASTRIPQSGRDKLITYADSRHILVIHNGNYYTLDVIDEAGTIRPASEILKNLQAIVLDETGDSQYPVAVLTSEDRDSWTSTRQELETLMSNTEPLKMIDSALFVLCLDQDEPETPGEVTKVFLHGDGKNRWFDKSIQLIVCRNGLSGVHFEHAWGDGVAVLRYFNEIHKDSIDNPACSSSQLASLDLSASTFRKLEFTLPSGFESKIKAAKENFDERVNSLDMETLQLSTFGREYLKRKKISPDAVMQLAFQMGYYRQHGKFVGTYESCSTAAFKHGRTETVRPASLATVACSQAFETTHKAGVDEMNNLIQKVSDYHNQLIKEAAMGQGFDRHFFGLRHLAESSGKVPKIFQDPSYTRLNHIILSTSTLSSPSVLMGGFAPVVPDGLGIGYSISDHELGCNVLSYGLPTDVGGFLKCVESSLEDLYEVMDGRNFKNKSG